MGNMIDVTNLCLTDNVMEVVAKVKAGEFAVDVQHLTVNERYSVGKLLGWKEIPSHWLHDPVTPSNPEEPDYEGMILDEQERDYHG